MKAGKKQKPGSAASARPGGGVLVPLLLLAAIGLAAYWNSFDVPLVFDDLVSIQRNASVRFGDYLNPSIFFRGILYITFTLNYMMSGQEVFGYHVVNLFLHIANGFLIYFIAKHIFEKTGVPSVRVQTFAFASAAFFTAHPVQTGAVTYVSSRSELLSTFFYAAAFLLFIKRRPERIGFAFSLVICGLFLLGIGAKETVISLPAVLVLYDFLFLSNSQPREMLARWRFYATFILGAVLVGYRLVTNVLVGSIGGDLVGHLSAWHYFLTQIRVLVRYVRLTFLPSGLNLDYDFRPSTSPAEPAVIASALFLLLIAVIGWRVRRKQPVFAFSIFWFFLTLAPTSSFVPLLDVIFEHRMYLPMVGICLSFPLLIHVAAASIPSRSTFRPTVVQVCSVLLVLAVGATISRNQVWRDEVRLWRDVIEKSPKKVRAYASLTFAFFKLGDYERALEATREGIRNIPDQKKMFYDQLGNMYLKLGRFQEAAGVFEEAVQAASNATEVSLASNNLGVTYLYMWNGLQQKRAQFPAAQFEQEKERILGSAEQAFIKSTESSTATFWAFDSYINVVHARGTRKEQVRSELLHKVSGKEAFVALYGLGKLEFLDENYRGCVEYFEKAEKLDRNQKVMFFNYAYALSKLNETDRAIEKYLQAIRIDPQFIEAHANIALLYMTKQDFQTAIERFNDVLRGNPNHLLAHLNMAKIYIQLGRRQEAREHLSTALNVSPGNREAMTLLQLAGS